MITLLSDIFWVNERAFTATTMSTSTEMRLFDACRLLCLNQAIEKISASLTLSFDLGLSAHGREYSYKLPWLIVLL